MEAKTDQYVVFIDLKINYDRIPRR